MPRKRVIYVRRDSKKQNKIDSHIQSDTLSSIIKKNQVYRIVLVVKLIHFQKKI